MELNSRIVIGKLNWRIEQTHQFLKKFQVRNGHSLLDHTVARYLWGAIATARLILTIARDHRFVGVMPLVRQLLETSFTLRHLLQTKNPDDAAACVFVWDILNAEELAAESQARMPHRERQMFTAEKALQEMCEELRSLDESADNIRRIYDEAKKRKKRHWHWTGRGPGAMIYEILSEGQEPDAVVDKFETDIFRSAWSDMSREAHATARWHIPGITFNTDSVLNFDDPLVQDDQKAAAIAGMASYFLQKSREYVAEYYERS